MKRRAVAGLILALMACSSPQLADAPMADQWVAAPLDVERIELGVEQIGRLRFRGGVALRSDAPMFGGFSGLEVLDDGRLIAVTDNADWFEARLVLNDAGDLIGVTNARMAFMRDETATPFESKVAGDAEGLAQLADGRFAVAFEQTQSIRIYDLNRDGPFGAAEPGPVLEGASRLRDNSGLEAIASDGNGALLVGAEGGGGPSPLWLAPADADAPVQAIARYRPARGFSLTSLDRLPEGGFVTLERFFAPIIGARARILVLPQTLSGEVRGALLGELAPPLPLDNFEGIAAVRMGETTRLYILSDDNFEARQRTLLYAFDILEDAD